MVLTQAATDSNGGEERQGGTGPRRQDERVRRAVEFLNGNYHRTDLRLEDIARAVNLSVWHLSHLFQSSIEIPPARLLKKIRLQHASILIATTELSVKEVMHKVGLSDQSHFAKDFKRAYGKSPTQYRADIRRSAYAERARAHTAARPT